MKILHIWDCAGVAGILAKYQNKIGYESKVVIRRLANQFGLRRFGINEIYNIEEQNVRARQFLINVIKEARKNKWDIIHFHAHLYYAFPFMNKPYVVHFHGSDLRFNEFIKLRYLIKPRFKVLVSTPDLKAIIPYATWLPNPIDTELFYPHKPTKKVYSKPINHKDMCDYLIQRGIHIQQENKVWALSKTSLEALASNIPVIWNGLTIKPPLPAIHKAKNVVKQLDEIYNNMLA